jgi:hypothetical protein
MNKSGWNLKHLQLGYTEESKFRLNEAKETHSLDEDAQVETQCMLSFLKLLLWVKKE